MTAGPDGAGLISDSELITAVRAGDRSAFGQLYTRHASAASSLARQFARSAAEVDDLVSEAFARVLDGLLAGKGPDTAFRAYLFTTLRHTAYDRTRKDSRLEFTGEIETHDVAVDAPDPVLTDMENGLIAKAFAQLPERWQTVLWHTQVEGQTPAEVAALLGVAPNAVTSLAFRAREGLREAYLQAHLAETAAERCRSTVDRLGAWTRGGLSKREKAQVDAHLEECDRCRALAAELAEINTGLRALLAPIVLGSAAIGYLATLGPVAPLAQVGVLTGAHAAASATAAAEVPNAAATNVVSILSRMPGKAVAGAGGRALVLGGMAAAAAVVIAVVIGLSHSPSQPPSAGNGPATASVTQIGSGGGGGGSTGGNGNGNGGGVGTGGTGTGAVSGPPAPTSSSGQVPTTSLIAPTTGSGSGTTVPTTSAPAGGLTSSSAGSGDTPGSSPVLNSTTTGSSTPGTSPTSGSTNTSGTPSSGTSETGSSTTQSASSGTSTGSSSTTSNPTSGTTGTSTSSTSTSTTTSSTTSTSTTTTSTTNGPPPALLVAGAPTVSADLVAGGAATLSLTVSNTGGTASAAGTLTATLPAGVTLTQVGGPTALRAFATAIVAQDQAPAWSLPAVAPGATATLVFTVVVDPTARATGTIAFDLDQQPLTSVDVTVGSGYSNVSVDGSALVPGSTDAVTLTATANDAVTDPGDLTISGWPAGVTPVAVITPADATDPTCAIDSDSTLTCPYAALSAGARVQLQVAAGAAPSSATPTATDAGGRELDLSPLTVAASPLGGFGSVTLTGPTTAQRAGTALTLTLHAAKYNALVLDPGTVTVQLPAGLALSGPLPTGCTATGTAVTCTLAAAGTDPVQLADVVLKLQIAASARGSLTPTIVLPVGSFASTPVIVNSKLGGYDTVRLAAAAPLLAGTSPSLTLTAAPGTGVTDPGTVTVPADLGDGATITAATGCTLDGTDWTCAANSTSSWALTASVAADATDAVLEQQDATLANGATLPLDSTGSDLTVRAAATSCATPVNLANGDFETPNPSTTALWKYPPSALTQWETNDPKGVFEYWRDGRAEHGVQYIELNATDMDTIWQTLATTPGQVLRWSLWHRGREGLDTMQVRIGAKLATAVAQLPDGQNTADITTGPDAWVQYTGTYTVPAGQTSTAFALVATATAKRGAHSSFGNFVDNVEFGSGPCLTATTTTSAATAKAGSTVTVTTTIRNDGGATAASTTLTTLLPRNATFDRWVSGPVGGPGTVVGSTLTARVLSPLVPGQSAVVIYRIVIGKDDPPGTPVPVSATLTYASEPPSQPLIVVSTLTTITVTG